MLQTFVDLFVMVATVLSSNQIQAYFVDFVEVKIHSTSFSTFHSDLSKDTKDSRGPSLGSMRPLPRAPPRCRSASRSRSKCCLPRAEYCRRKSLRIPRPIRWHHQSHEFHDGTHLEILHKFSACDRLSVDEFWL